MKKLWIHFILALTLTMPVWADYPSYRAKNIHGEGGVLDDFIMDNVVIDNSTLNGVTDDYYDPTSSIQDQLDSKQPLESTLTDIADGIIEEDLVNTAYPWLDNEVSNTLTLDNSSVINGVSALYYDPTSSIQNQIDSKEALANKGVASGYAPLDSSGALDIGYLQFHDYSNLLLNSALRDGSDSLWSMGSKASIIADNTAIPFGYAIKLDASGGACGGNCIATNPWGSYWIPTYPYERFYVSARAARGDTPDQPLQIILQVVDVDGNYLGNSTLSISTGVTSSDWERFATTLTMPADAARFQVIVYSTTTTSYWKAAGVYISRLNDRYVPSDYLSVFTIDDANSSTLRGKGVSFYYHTSPYTNKPSAATNYGFIQTLCWDSSWCTQYWYGINDADKGQSWRRGTVDGSTWTTWERVWGDATDGTGSGLDADLLDGKHYTDFDNTALTFVIDGGGAEITTGIKGDLVAPFAMTIEEAWLLADQSGSIQIDVWKDTYANFPPTVADSIDTYSISTATKSQETGLSISVSSGDIIRFNVDSVTTITRCTIYLKVSRN